MELRTPWLGAERGYLSDWVTQRWVQATGRLVRWADVGWLAGPVGAPGGIGADFFESLARAERWTARVNAPGAGLIEDFAALRGPSFDPDRVDRRIVRFYERTAEYELDVWSEWCGVFRPFGRLLAVIFSRRLQQLNLPLSPLDTSAGITSQIIQLVRPDTGRVASTGWLRRMASTGDVIYAGAYSPCAPPAVATPCVKVVFPLPNGSATVVMAPRALEDGSLELLSRGRSFGDPGFYFVVARDRGTAWVRYLRALRERIHVFVDSAGVARADHVLTLWGAVFLRLHYRMRGRS